MSYVAPLFATVQQGELKVLMQLLSRDPSVINECDETGQTILHSACSLEDLNIVRFLLNRQDCNFTIQEHLYGYTPLHVACLYECQRIVQELLKGKLSKPDFVNMKDKFGWSALHHAARNGNLDICKMLLANGATPSLTNEAGKTACHYAAQYGHLHVLTYIYDYVVESITPPIVPQEAFKTPTLLHCAAINAHANVIQWLRQKSFPPIAKCRRLFDLQENRCCDQFPDEVAESRGHSSLKSSLLTYRQMYQEWISNISKSEVTLDRIKLCICGFTRVGKSAMRQSLSKPYLRSLLGKNIEETTEGDVNRSTFGIEITSMQLSGKDLFSVWDFAGQIDNFITHQFFISTQSTVFTVLINLTDDINEQRIQLMRWLGLIKMRNLGQITLSTGLKDTEKDVVPMPNCNDKFYENALPPVPVIIIGSHYDQIKADNQQETISSVQGLVDEMKLRFGEYLEVSPHLYPLNCLRAVSPEIKLLKDHLCEVRAKLLEVQPLYPRVVELVARKTESLRVEQPNLKVLKWERMKSLVQDEVNKLLSDRQLAYVLKCLTNAGVLVYFDQGALTHYIFIDPGWLCQDVLGKALAPESFPVSQIASIGSAQISEDVLHAKFSEHIDKEDILELLQHFDLCYRLKDNRTFEFPAFIESPLDFELWKPSSQFTNYCGRHLVCIEETDTFPPGFFSRLQVLISKALKQEKVYHFKNSFVIDAIDHQSLVQIVPSCTAINLLGRSGKLHARSCIRLLDVIQNQIAALIRDVCPTIFIDLMIPSCADLKLHKAEPHYYSIHETVTGESVVLNSITNNTETVTDLLYMGDVEYQTSNGGNQTKIAYIPMEIIMNVQELLRDGDTGWKNLAKAINLEKYVQLLESRTPESTRWLLLKWAEKPKWTVLSLLCALKEIKREDVYNYVRARF